MKKSEVRAILEKVKVHIKKTKKKHEIACQNKFGYKEKLAHTLTIEELRKIEELVG